MITMTTGIGRMADEHSGLKMMATKYPFVINWNHLLPNAGAPAYALGKRGAVPDDLIQYALEWEERNYAKRFKQDSEPLVYDTSRRIIVDSDVRKSPATIGWYKAQLMVVSGS